MENILKSQRKWLILQIIAIEYMIGRNRFGEDIYDGERDKKCQPPYPNIIAQ